MRLTFARTTAIGLFLSITACQKHVKPSAAPPPPPPDPVKVALEGADRAFGLRDYAAAMSGYDHYLDLAPRGEQVDRALFQQAVIYTIPLYPGRDPEMTRARLKKLIDEHPSSTLRPAAEIILDLYQKNVELTADKQQGKQRIEELTAELGRAQQKPSKLAIEEAGQELAANNCTKAAARFEDYLRLEPKGDQRDAALFNLGVCYSSAEFKRDWNRAAPYFKQVAGPLKVYAQAILSLRDEISQLSADSEKNNQKIKQLNTELDRLKQIDARPRRP
jgi:hypothetical protein